MPRGIGRTLIIVAAVAGAAYFGYRHFAPHGGPQGMMPGGAPPVSVAEVIQRNIQQWHEYSGRIVPVESVEIRPRVSGNIEQIHFKEGQLVEKGQLLFTIDQKPYKAALDAAQARYTLALEELKRATSLVKDKAMPVREFDQRKSNAEVAEADLVRAKLDYDYTLVKAPVAGRVSRAEITVGNLVDAGPNAPVLTTVVSNRPIYADFDMDEQSFLHYVNTGADPEKMKDIPVFVGLSGEEGAPHTGHVQSFDNQLNVNTGTIRIRAVFDNDDGRLVPGLFARVRLGSAVSTPALLITDRAVGTDQNRKFVLVLDGENKVEYRQVELDGISDGLRVVSSGLKPGEVIVVNGLQRAQPGMPVTPELVSMDAADAPPPAAQGGESPAPDTSANSQ